MAKMKKHKSLKFKVVKSLRYCVSDSWVCIQGVNDETLCGFPTKSSNHKISGTKEPPDCEDCLAIVKFCEERCL